MATENFEVGDVVKLKSGSPNMTIVEIDTYEGILKARCRWFAGERADEVREDVFTLESLTKKG